MALLVFIASSIVQNKVKCTCKLQFPKLDVLYSPAEMCNHCMYNLSECPKLPCFVIIEVSKLGTINLIYIRLMRCLLSESTYII